MNAKTILEEQVSSWGEKDLYLVTEDEFKILLSEGGVITEDNLPNEDGTFFSSLLFQSRKFCISARKKCGG